MFTASFWKSAVERAIKTVAQALVAVIAGASFDWFTADWQAVAGVALTAGVLSILTSIAGEGIGPKGSPSVVAESIIPPGQ